MVELENSNYIDIADDKIVEFKDLDEADMISCIEYVAFCLNDSMRYQMGKYGIHTDSSEALFDYGVDFTYFFSEGVRQRDGYMLTVGAAKKPYKQKELSKITYTFDVCSKDIRFAYQTKRKIIEIPGDYLEVVLLKLKEHGVLKAVNEIVNNAKEERLNFGKEFIKDNERSELDSVLKLIAQRKAFRITANLFSQKKLYDYYKELDRGLNVKPVLRLEIKKTKRSDSWRDIVIVVPDGETYFVKTVMKKEYVKIIDELKIRKVAYVGKEVLNSGFTVHNFMRLIFSKAPELAKVFLVLDDNGERKSHDRCIKSCFEPTEKDLKKSGYEIFDVVAILKEKLSIYTT